MNKLFVLIAKETRCNLLQEGMLRGCRAGITARKRADLSDRTLRFHSRSVFELCHIISATVTTVLEDEWISSVVWLAWILTVWAEAWSCQNVQTNLKDVLWDLVGSINCA